MRTHLLLALAVSLLASNPLFAADDADADAKAAFKRGVELMDKQAFKDAIPLLKQAEKSFPDAPGLLWNLGIASAEIQDHAEALAYWQKYRKCEPDDWKAIPKLIQTYQATGDLKARDRELEGLYALRAGGKDAAVAKAEKFCREQFVVEGRRVFAFEVFDPQGPRRMSYRFSVVDAEGREAEYVSLGSYDSTTEVARETGQISEKQRLYHLDRYRGDTHWTYAFFTEKPTYEAVRTSVVSILQGKTEAVSSSSRPKPAQPGR
jgi:tetratricopeptide (TPR) repeat protein